jgi:hypothetical protein
MIKKEEHAKECEQAAAIIQRKFQKYSKQRALTIASQPSLALASPIMWTSTAASIALSFDNDDASCISVENSSDKAEEQFEDNAASKDEMTALNEPYYKEGKGMEEEKEEEKEPPSEQAPEIRPETAPEIMLETGLTAGAARLCFAAGVREIMGGRAGDADDINNVVHSAGGTSAE